ncbi:Tlg2-vesicle protein [Phlyctochytrium planicorne]|nr:Tlg2-vesicle protein [Phlyctochytrium planicorne]
MELTASDLRDHDAAILNSAGLHSTPQSHYIANSSIPSRSVTPSHHISSNPPSSTHTFEISDNDEFEFYDDADDVRVTSMDSPEGSTVPGRTRRRRWQGGSGKKCCPTSVSNALGAIFASRWTALWAIALMSLIMAVLLYHYHDKILKPLMDFCDAVRKMGFTGYLIMGLLVFSACFPPLIGYGSYLVMCGFIFGFPWGFFPAYIGALIGAVLCFLGARKFLGRHYRDYFLSKYPKLKVVEAAIEKGGLKLIVLIRLAPYPFGIINVIFSTTSISVYRFAAATSIAATKNMIHVYIGSTLQSLVDIGGGRGKDKPPKDPNAPPGEGDGQSSTSKIVEVAFMVAGIVFAIGGMAYMTHLLQKEIMKSTRVEGGEEEHPLQPGDVEDIGVGRGSGLSLESNFQGEFLDRDIIIEASPETTSPSLGQDPKDSHDGADGAGGGGEGGTPSPSFDFDEETLEQEIRGVLGAGGH